MRVNYKYLPVMVSFAGAIAVAGCSKTSLPVVKPAAVAEARQVVLAINPSGRPYSVRQQAWLNFVEKVRRGEQVDPTGQYVADGTIVPANARAARPKFDAATDAYPFLLLPDGTVVMRPASELKAIQAHRPLPPGPGCDVETECPQGPAVTSTFVSSVGVGGSGDIVDIKVYYDGAYPPIYNLLNSDLNKGAGGSVIYYYFTRNPNELQKGDEYDKPFQFPSLSVFDPIVAYDVKEKHYYFGTTPAESPGFAYMWHPNDPKTIFGTPLT